MHLFLQGARQVGKSTLLRQAAAPYGKEIGGFTVQRLWRGDRWAGFQAAVIAGTLPPADIPDHGHREGVFLDDGVRYPERLAAVVERAAGMIRDPRCTLILLDEIGGAELRDPAVWEDYRAMLGTGKPCVGVFKSSENLESMLHRQRLEDPRLAELLRARHAALERMLRAEGMLLTVTPDNREAVRRRLEDFLTAIFRPVR